MPGVLIIKFGALGDVLMAAPIVRRIVAHHHGARVQVLTAPEHYDFFTRWPGVQVQAFPRRGLGTLIRALCWVRAQRFARIYDLQSSDRSGLLCLASGARERVGNHARLPYSHHPPTPWRGTGHIHARWREVLESAGVDPGPDAAWLPITAGEREQAQAWAERHGIAGKPFAILHAGTSPGHVEKRWPGFGALAAALRGAGLAVVWAGGRADRELNRELARAGDIDASEAFTLPGLAALGEMARFAVTNDSAPMHALACAGIPVFGLFGPTNWRRNHAIGQAGNVIAAGPPGAEFSPVALGALATATVVSRLRAAGLLP